MNTPWRTRGPEIYFARRKRGVVRDAMKNWDGKGLEETNHRCSVSNGQKRKSKGRGLADWDNTQKFREK